MAEWKIRRRHGECTRCQSVFEEGGRLASVLRLDEEKDLLREDLCESCWGADSPATYLFWWFTRFHASRKRTLQLDLGSLERLFMELEGKQEQQLAELRYLLCLLLMRKRKLKLKQVKRGKQGEELILRRPRRDENLAVWVFDFTPERIEELRLRLQEVLEGAGPAEQGGEAEDAPEGGSERGPAGDDSLAQGGLDPDSALAPSDPPDCLAGTQD